VQGSRWLLFRWVLCGAGDHETAPDRVLGLALLDTTARPDTRAATDARRDLMQLAESNFPAVIQALLPRQVHPSRLSDPALVQVIGAMADSVGKEAFLRQQRAIIGRVDSRPSLPQIGAHPCIVRPPGSDNPC